MSTGSLLPASAAETRYREGDAAHDAGQFGLAEALLRSALAIDPEHWMARYTLAVVLQDLGRQAEAATLYAEALAVRPEHVKAWNNFGVALQYSDRRDEAIAAFQRALELTPDHPGALSNLSGLLAEAGRTDQARRVLDPFCNAETPNLFDLRRALMLPPVAASGEEIRARRAAMLADLRRIAARPPRLRDPLREVGRTPFYLAYQPESDREILETLATLYRRACPELSWVAPACRQEQLEAQRAVLREAPPALRPEAPGRRVRIGFASFFFYEHSVGRVIRGLVEHLPRQRFEVVVIFLGGQADDPLARVMATAADAVLATPYDLAAAREAIAALKLDVLCLPDFGLEPLSYFLGFARLAPVQCTTWGHAETSGIDTIDWYVSTEHFERPDADTDYTERLYRLPGVASPAWYPLPLRQPGGRSRIDPANGPNYFCAQTVYKLHPDFDPLLAAILAAQPEARLYLVRSAEPVWDQRLAARLAGKLGDLMRQVVWLEVMPRADYEATVLAADLILDPPYFTGGNTSLEAFALGRPVLTLQGKTMRSRFTAGFYRAMDLAEMISETPEAYVRQAVLLGQNPALRAELAQKIADHKSVLFEDPAVLARWAEFFELALRRR